MVVPFYHSNMGSVLPVKAKLFGVGHEVTVTVGERSFASGGVGGSVQKNADCWYC